ncbi:uncharacterized protein LOC105832583 [Monomorium pharaonis]|uniref:uncharacterized protein LOC105832583 n=1 Tax=Monomorium pharaonis TaxID=307658 RepID=UPI0017477A62|nr:uncharacterized protein LOC105832583 [Monomorium pharaonis]
MQSYLQRYYHINKILMSWVGTWPYQNRTIRILILSTLVVTAVIFNIAGVIRMVNTWGNIDIAVEWVINLIVFFGCFIKLFNLNFNIKKLQHLFTLIEYHWHVLTDSIDVEIMQNYVTLGRKVVIFYATYIFTTALLFMLLPLTPLIMDIVMPLNESRPRKLLFEVEYYVDQQKYYYLLLLHSYMVGLIHASIMVSVDTTYITYVQHGCSLFAVSGYRLKHIVSKEHISRTSYVVKSKGRIRQDIEAENICFKEKAIFSEFVACLRKHQLAIEYAGVLESSFSKATALLLLINMIGISFMGIQVISNLNNTKNAVRYSCLCLAAFIHLLIMSLPGQRLMDHSLDVFNNICRSHWYEFSLKTKKMLPTLLYRSNIPCTLTASKVYVMSMANYGMVVKTAMSYFTAFSSLQVLLLYDTWGDLNIAVDCLVNFVIIIGGTIKLTNIVVNNNKVSYQIHTANVHLLLSFFFCIVDQFRRLLQHMSEHWELFNSEFEQHILRYYANIGQKIRSYYGVYVIVALTLYLSMPLVPRILDVVIPLNESRPLMYVYEAEYRVDKERYYYPILFHSCVATSITAIILFTVDTTYIMCVLHACSLFTAVSQRLENITGKTDIKSDDNENIQIEMYYHVFMEKRGSIGNNYRELIMCLKKHQLALEHAEILNSMFTDVTFVLLFTNMLILSIIGIQLINNIKNTGESIRYICILFGVFLHLACMCIPGQLLINHSIEIFDKAYNLRWYTFSIETRRLLTMLLYRSLIPCKLTAGKSFVMSITMLSTMIRTAMSYFTTFLSMR